jgi:acyl-CoA reductase-like NAD-dependent aldehyde dehydrogenase
MRYNKRECEMSKRKNKTVVLTVVESEAVSQHVESDAVASVARDESDVSANDVSESVENLSQSDNAVSNAASETKSTWGDVVAKARVSFAKRRAFRENTNRATIYAMLQRESGVSLAQASAAIKNTSRKLNSLYTDFHDIATITQRKLVMSKRDDVAYYTLKSNDVVSNDETSQA